MLLEVNVVIRLYNVDGILILKNCLIIADICINCLPTLMFVFLDSFFMLMMSLEH